MVLVPALSTPQFAADVAWLQDCPSCLAYIPAALLFKHVHYPGSLQVPPALRLALKPSLGPFSSPLAPCLGPSTHQV